MSLLIFSHQKESISVITDTLATDIEGNPYLLVTKSYIIPHLDMVISNTGLAAIGQEWAGRVFSRMLCRNIDMLAEFAPSCLQEIHADITKQFNCGDLESTIYHFGYSERHGQYVRYVFRSKSKYKTELNTEPGFGIKPIPEGAYDVPETQAKLIALAERVREEQRQRPLSEQIHIGGELNIVTMANKRIISSKLHAFSDLEDQWRAMNASLRESKNKLPR
jgi:hypothetical protein